jgi:hypothetical protein
MTAVLCSFCQSDTGPSDSIGCIGPCSRVFHHNCTGLAKSNLKALIECPNLFFKCELCATGCYKPLEDKIEMLAQQVSNLKGTVDKLVVDNMKTPKAAQQVKHQLTLRKPVAGSSNDTPNRPGNARKVVRGTGPKADTILMAEPKFWMHLSELDPKTEEEALTDFLSNQFDSDSIKCIKLLPRNRPIDSCESISFKIGFPKDMEEDAMDPGNWPEGFTVRKFVERQSQQPRTGFRGPRTPYRTPFRSRSRTPFGRDQWQEQRWNGYNRRDGYNRRSDRY